jgi:hypothetical protein
MGQHEILGNTVTLNIKGSEIVFGLSAPLTSCEFVPPPCFQIVLQNALAFLVHHAKVMLRSGVTLLSKRFENL